MQVLDRRSRSRSVRWVDPFKFQASGQEALGPFTHKLACAGMLANPSHLFHPLDDEITSGIVRALLHVRQLRLALAGEDTLAAEPPSEKKRHTTPG